MISFGYYFKTIYALSAGAMGKGSQELLTTAKLAALSLVLLSAALFLQPQLILGLFHLA